MKRGERYVFNADKPLRYRTYIEVTRVAKDGSWADIRVCNWACMWSKRQPLGLIEKHLTAYEWNQSDLDAQMNAWTAA